MKFPFSILPHFENMPLEGSGEGNRWNDCALSRRTWKRGIACFLFFSGVLLSGIAHAVEGGEREEVREEKNALRPSLPSSGEHAENAFPGAVRERRPLMGTVFTVMVIPPAGMERKEVSKAVSEAFHEAEKLQSVASAFDAESELSRLNRMAVGREMRLSPGLFAILERACRIAELSKGSFDPALGAASRLWRRARSRGVLPGDMELKQALAGCGYQKLKLKPETGSAVRTHLGLLVDLGGIGKGAAMDLMAASLRKSGIACFRLSTTSDILVGDPPPGHQFWKIVLFPSRQEVKLVREAVSTSGTTNQFALVDGKKYAHLIDPATGLGTTRKVSISAVAADSATADAGATALIFMKPEQRKKFCSEAGIKEFFVTEQKKGD